MDRTQEDYLDDYLGMIRNDPDFQIPQFEVEEDENLVESIMDYLQENGVFEDGEVNWEKFEQLDPNLFKAVQASISAEVQYNLDSLIEKGYIEQSVNEDGEFVYHITPEGEELAKHLGM